MDESENHLERAERHVRQGATRIDDLKARIAELELHKHARAAAVARELLHTLEESQKLAIEHLRIERQFAERK